MLRKNRILEELAALRLGQSKPNNARPQSSTNASGSSNVSFSGGAVPLVTNRSFIATPALSFCFAILFETQKFQEIKSTKALLLCQVKPTLKTACSNSLVTCWMIGSICSLWVTSVLLLLVVHIS